MEHVEERVMQLRSTYLDQAAGANMCAAAAFHVTYLPCRLPAFGVLPPRPRPLPDAHGQHRTNTALFQTVRLQMRLQATAL